MLLLTNFRGRKPTFFFFFAMSKKKKKKKKNHPCFSLVQPQIIISHIIFKFTFYIYIYIYYDLLFTVIHTLFVSVGNRKYYTQYIIFLSQYFLIFFLFFVYLVLYFSYIFQKMFLFFLLYFSIQALEGLRTVLLQNISRTESLRVGFHIWTNLGNIFAEFL